MKTLRWIRLILIALLAGGAVVWFLRSQMQESINVLSQDQPSQGLPKIGGPYRLIDQFGEERTDEEFQGRYALIYFGYSFCPDVCPLGLQNISEGLKRLERNRDDIVPIFITVDPKRDTTENLKLYASNFHPNFIMLTGAQSKIDQAMKNFRVYASKATPDGTSADYLIDHSTLIYLMDRQGQFIAYFPHTTPPETLAKELRKYLSKDFKHS